MTEAATIEPGSVRAESSTQVPLCDFIYKEIVDKATTSPPQKSESMQYLMRIVKPAAPVAIAEFARRLYRLVSRDEHKAVDEIYNYIDDRLLAGDTSACKVVLESVDPRKLLPSTASIISMLIVTRRAKPKLLPERNKFISNALDALTQQEGPEEATRLLTTYC